MISKKLLLVKIIMNVHNIGVTAFNMENQVNFKVDESESTLQFILDDLGCNGTESNLLECLPKHNCMQNPPEEAGVRCLRRGTVIIIIINIVITIILVISTMII